MTTVSQTVVESLNTNYLGVVIFIVVFYVTWTILARPKGLPPGPRGVPIFGYLPFLNNEGGVSSIAIKYGKLLNSDVIYLDLWFRKIIMLNSYDKIKELFQKRDDCIDRFENNFFRKFLPGHEGLIFASGKVWKEHRRFSLSVLRDFGMGKVTAESLITNEVCHSVEAFEKTKGTSVNPRGMITEASSNIICALIFGQRYEYDDEDFCKHVQSVNKLMTDSGRATSTLLLRPWMRYLPKCLDVYGFQSQQRNFASIIEFAQARIAEHKVKFDQDNIKDYIDAFLLRMKEGDGSFTDLQLSSEIFDLFFAGAETTSTTLHWAIYYMAKYPEIQEKVQGEIDSLVGRHCPLKMKDRLRLPYSQAVLMEVQRMATILPAGVYHCNCNQDITIGKYSIPKGMLVSANLMAVHRDPQTWPDPENFNPRNFMDEDGKLKNQERLIPFLLGRRSCIGESLAKMELFLFFTSWLQKFTIISSDRSELDGPRIGFIKQPSPFRVRFQER